MGLLNWIFGRSAPERRDISITPAPSPDERTSAAFVLGADVQELYGLFAGQTQTIDNGLLDRSYEMMERRLRRVRNWLLEHNQDPDMLAIVKDADAILLRHGGEQRLEEQFEAQVRAYTEMGERIDGMMGELRESLDDVKQLEYTCGLLSARIVMCVRAIDIVRHLDVDPGDGGQPLLHSYLAEYMKTGRLLGVVLEQADTEVKKRVFDAATLGALGTLARQFDDDDCAMPESVSLMGTMVETLLSSLGVGTTPADEDDRPNPTQGIGGSDLAFELFRDGIGAAQGGDLESALGKFHEASELARVAEEPALEGEAEFSLAEIYGRIGVTIDSEQHDRERLHAERALRSFRSAQHAEGCLKALSKLAMNALNKDDFKLAGHYREEITAQDHPSAEWWALYVAGRISTNLSDFGAARESFEACLERGELLSPVLWQAFEPQVRRQLAYGLLEDPERIAEALPLMRENLEAAERAGHHTEALRCCLALEVASLSAERADDAYTYSGRCAELANLIRSGITSPQKQREFSARFPAYRTLLVLAIERGHFDLAFDTLQMSRSRAILNQMGLASLWHKFPASAAERDGYEKIVAQERDAVEGLHASARESSTVETGLHNRWLDRLEARRNRLYEMEEALVVRAGGGHALPPAVTLADLQARLPDDVVVVEYVLEGPLALVVTRDKLDAVDLPNIDFDEAVAAYRSVITEMAQASGARSESADFEADTVLYGCCVTPILPFLPEGSEVLLVPSGKLWDIPLHTLGGEAALCWRFSSAAVFGASVLAWLLEREDASGRETHFVGIADPDGTLPGARREVIAAAGVFEDPIVLSGEEATPEAVLAALRVASIAHFACHGEHLDEYPEFDYLKLAGEPGTEYRIDVSTTAAETIAAELVVMSACHSGRGGVAGGDEFVGFPSAFLAAGARSVLGSLWSIDDEAAFALMDHFYGALESEGAAGALRSAQRALYESAQYRHPYFWAAFQVFGLPLASGSATEHIGGSEAHRHRELHRAAQARERRVAHRSPPCPVDMTTPVGPDLEAGKAAYRLGDYTAALRKLTPLAEQGHAEAQFLVGFIMYHGRGVRANAREGVKWYRMAAEQGHAVAQFTLGVIYEAGKGVPEDDHEALKWIRMAAEQGLADGQCNLAFRYANGKGVREDGRESLKWSRMAAEQGDARGQYNLGVIYHNGKGVAEDAREAAKWYRMAAEQGHAVAQFILGALYADGEGVPENKREAVNWIRMAAEQGHADGQYHLGLMYHGGKGVAEDARKAVKWIRMAAEQGHADGQYGLGLMYHTGDGVVQDVVQAWAWYNLAAAQGNEWAIDNREHLRESITADQIAAAEMLSRRLSS